MRDGIMLPPNSMQTLKYYHYYAMKNQQLSYI